MNTTIAEIANMTGGDPILGMTVTVKSAFPPKGGTNEYGDWSVQNTTVEDETGSIKAAFFNSKVNFKNFIGQQITIKSGKDGKGKFSGIEVYDYSNKKTGAVERQIKVSEYATIDEAVGSAGAASVGPSAPPTAGVVGTPNVRPANQGNGRANFVEDSEVKRASIERQKALELAVAFDNSGTIDETLRAAEKFYAFLSGQGPEPKAEAEPTPQVEGPKAQAIIKPEEETHADEVL